MRIQLSTHAAARCLLTLALLQTACDRGITTPPSVVEPPGGTPAPTETQVIHSNASSDQAAAFGHGTSVLQPSVDTTIYVSQGGIASYAINTVAEFRIDFTTGDADPGSAWKRDIKTLSGVVLYSASSPLFPNTHYATTYSQAASYTPGQYGSYKIVSTSNKYLCFPFPIGCRDEEAKDTVSVVLADSAAATVTVSPATATISVGATVALTATIRDQFGNVLPGRVATWSSSNAAVATVTSTGNLTARVDGVGEGQATIQATIDGINGSSTITVNVPPLAVSISGPQQLMLHESGQYFANASGGVPPYTYEWRSRQCFDSQGSSCGAWQNWFSTGSTNYTFASVNGCAIRRNELQARVTDSRPVQATSSTYAIIITNPC